MRVWEDFFLQIFGSCIKYPIWQPQSNVKPTRIASPSCSFVCFECTKQLPPGGKFYVTFQSKKQSAGSENAGVSRKSSQSAFSVLNYATPSPQSQQQPDGILPALFFPTLAAKCAGKVRPQQTAADSDAKLSRPVARPGTRFSLCRVPFMCLGARHISGVSGANGRMRPGAQTTSEGGRCSCSGGIDQGGDFGR